MRTCMQFPGVSVLDHGHLVRERYVDLRDRLLHGGMTRLRWRLPDWIADERLVTSIASSDDRLMELYQVYHDCGKPLCLEVDGEGRQHFPDHAIVSARRWLDCTDGSCEALWVSWMIRMDMDFHLLRPEGVGSFSQRPVAGLLILTALSELHANAEMFGGIESDGFRSKYRRADRLGGRVVRLLGGL